MSKRGQDWIRLPRSESTPTRTIAFGERIGLACGVGLGIGALTSVLQAHLAFPWLSLANAASPWVVPMFAVGILCHRGRDAVAAGLVTGISELVGYYATASLSGHAAGSHTILVFWVLCAVIGGPVFGWAGWRWWHFDGPLSLLAATTLPAAFLAEALIGYALRLHYWSSAVLFAILGLLSMGIIGLRRHDHLRLAEFLFVTLAFGAIAEVALGKIYV